MTSKGSYSFSILVLCTERATSSRTLAGVCIPVALQHDGLGPFYRGGFRCQIFCTATGGTATRLSDGKRRPLRVSSESPLRIAGLDETQEVTAITSICTSTNTVYSVSTKSLLMSITLSNSSTKENVQPTSNGVLCNICYKHLGQGDLNPLRQFNIKQMINVV